MTKPNRYFTIVGLLIFLLLCMVPNGQAQACVPVSQGVAPSWQVGLKCTFTAASTPVSFSANGLVFWQIFSVPTGTLSAASLSLDSSATGLSWSTGGILSAGTIGSLTSATSYSNSSATTPTNFAQLTPTVTGTGTITVTLFGYVNNPAIAGGAGGSNVTVTNFPATQPVSGTFWQTTQPVSLATAPTTPTQPVGLASLIEFQQAVTASATALSTNAAHAFCIQALPLNALTVYVGGSGETTSTGYPLQPGQYVCPQLSNTNLVYVIASGTGSSVAVFGF
jgi:hypothetical protein